MRLPLWSALVLLCAGMTHAQQVQSIQGQAEVRLSNWQPLAEKSTLQNPIRTLLGRVEITVPQGRFLLGSNSEAQPRNGEVQLLNGQGYVEGQFPFFLGTAHVYIDGRARVDITPTGATISVLEGKARLSVPQKGILYVPEKKAYILNRDTITDFQEDDAWYDNDLVGTGTLQVAALRGTVEVQKSQQWQKLKVKNTLGQDQVVKTSLNSWAEFVFEDGSYFRLNEKSQVRVESIEKLSSGKRRVTLKLEAGTAWNVVQKGKGGYQFRTATLVAGVRGTTFRLDSDDTLKVFEGTVAASQNDQSLPVQANQQFNPATGPETLKLDAKDRFNQRLDALRNQPLTIQLDPLPAGPLRTFAISGTTLPGTDLQYVTEGQTLPLDVDDDGRFSLALELPEGLHTFALVAERNNQNVILNQSVQLEKEKPAVVPPPVTAVQLQPAVPFKVEAEVVPPPPAPAPVELQIELAPFASKVLSKLVLSGQTDPAGTLRYEEGERTLILPLDAEGKFSVPMDLADGEHTFTLRVNRDNSEFALAQTVRIDSTPPEVLLLEARKEGSWLLLDLRVQDSTSVTLQLLGYTLTPDGSTLRIPFMQDTPQVQIVLTDEAGNTIAREVTVQ